MTKSVLFFRDGRWHAGWVQEVREDGFRVAWIDGIRLLSKVVEKVVEVPGVDWEVLANRKQ